MIRRVTKIQGELEHDREKIDERFLNINEIEKRIIKGEDIIGRDDSFNKIPLDSLFPSYLIENKDKYKDWIDE